MFWKENTEYFLKLIILFLNEQWNENTCTWRKIIENINIFLAAQGFDSGPESSGFITQ